MQEHPQVRIPILKLEQFLLVSIQVELDDQTAMALQDDLAQRISQSRARGVLIDISALELVDSYVGRILAEIASIGRLMDAETIVAGMQPAVAITLVELGVPLTGLRTALNMDHGMRLLREVIGGAGGRKEAADGQPAGR